jgi:hypothetical protein
LLTLSTNIRPCIILLRESRSEVPENLPKSGDFIAFLELEAAIQVHDGTGLPSWQETRVRYRSLGLRSNRPITRSAISLNRSESGGGLSPAGFLAFSGPRQTHNQFSGAKERKNPMNPLILRPGLKKPERLDLRQDGRFTRSPIQFNLNKKSKI